MPPSSRFADFAAVAGAVASTSSKLRKRDLLAEYLRGLPRDDVPVAATFFAGRPLPGAQDRLGLGWVQQSQALAAASGADAAALNAAYLRHSDLGDAAAELLADQQPAGPPLTLAEVDARLPRHERGRWRRCPGRLMMALFCGRATAEEARFVGRIAAREMRIGLREGLLEEAIAAAFERPIEAVRRALMLVGEPGEAAALARRRRAGHRRAAPGPADPLHARHAGGRRGRGDAPGRRARPGSRTSTTASGRSCTWRTGEPAPLQPRPERHHRLVPGGRAAPQAGSAIGW